MLIHTCNAHTHTHTCDTPKHVCTHMCDSLFHSCIHPHVHAHTCTCTAPMCAYVHPHAHLSLQLDAARRRGQAAVKARMFPSSDPLIDAAYKGAECTACNAQTGEKYSHVLKVGGRDIRLIACLLPCVQVLGESWAVWHRLHVLLLFLLKLRGHVCMCLCVCEHAHVCVREREGGRGTFSLVLQLPCHSYVRGCSHGLPSACMLIEPSRLPSVEEGPGPIQEAPCPLRMLLFSRMPT